MFTDAGKAAYITAQTLLAEIELEGMLAENRHRLDCGQSIAYGVEAFTELRQRYEPIIGHNAVIGLFQE